MHLDLPLIEARNTLLIRWLILAGIAILVLTALDLMFFSGNLAIWAIAASICFGIAVSMKDYRITGSITLSANEIILNAPSGSASFPVPQLENLELQLAERKGKAFAFNSLATQQGSGNSINFRYKGENVKISFLLERETQAALTAVIHEWSQITTIKCFNPG